MPVRRVIAAIAVALAAAPAGCGGGGARPHRTGQQPTPSPSPAPGAPLPAAPAALAADLAATDAALDAAIDDWRAHGDPARGEAPAPAQALALRQQRISLRLATKPALVRSALPRLPAAVAAEARDVVAAERALAILNRPTGPRRFRTGPAEPADVLRAHYGEAWKRSGVRPTLLAAVNFVESAFGRLRSPSTAGAQGPMQFIPSTWAAYGRGGDVHNPRDAILAAARFLRAAGAPGSERRALYAYNPSPLYVTAVSAFARVMRRHRRAFYALYAWPVVVRTVHGLRRLTGSGR